MGKSVIDLVEDALTLHKQAGRLKKAGFESQSRKIDGVARKRLNRGLVTSRRKPGKAGSGKKSLT